MILTRWMAGFLRLKKKFMIIVRNFCDSPSRVIKLESQGDLEPAPQSVHESESARMET